MKFGDWGYIPSEIGNYSTLYYKDAYSSSNDSSHGIAVVGGSPSTDIACGAFCLFLTASTLGYAPDAGTNLSCKPCASNQS